MNVVADQGLAEFSLEDVAARADVTRNLLYHYFPRGRADIALAAVKQAGRELTENSAAPATFSAFVRVSAVSKRLGGLMVGEGRGSLLGRVPL